MHCTVGEAQERLTSTGFLQRLCYLDMVESQHDRTDYMLASIVAEIRSFKNGFSKDGKPVSIKECLLFDKENQKDESEDDGGTEEDLNGQSETKDLIEQERGRQDVPEVDRPVRRKRKKKGLELGDPLNDKWKAVAANAKAVWAARFGMATPPPLEDPATKPEAEEGEGNGYW